MGCGASAEKKQAPTGAAVGGGADGGGGEKQIRTGEGSASTASRGRSDKEKLPSKERCPSKISCTVSCPSKERSVAPSRQLHRDLSFQDWGVGDLKVVTASNLSVTAPLAIVEPWEHVGFNGLSEPVRASTNVAMLAERIGIESQCIPLWQEGTDFQVHSLVEAFEGKTLVFEGGHPSVYDPSSFTHERCPREFLFSVYKHVMLMSRKFVSVTFICLSHQLAIAALVELVKDAVEALQHSGDANLVAVGDEIQATGRQVKILKDGEVLCVGYDHVNDKGCDHFATAPNEQKETALLQLHPFDASDYLDREDLKQCAEAQQKVIQSALNDEIKQQLAEDSDGFWLAMFHSDEVNVEAVLFANWAFGRISCVAHQLPTTLEWLKELPVAVEVTACTRDDITHEMVTEVASMRIDYVVDGARKSYYSFQFHPELNGSLSDSRHLLPQAGEDGERLLHSILLGRHIKPTEAGGYEAEEDSQVRKVLTRKSFSSPNMFSDGSLDAIMGS